MGSRVFGGGGVGARVKQQSEWVVGWYQVRCRSWQHLRDDYNGNGRFLLTCNTQGVATQKKTFIRKSYFNTLAYNLSAWTPLPGKMGKLNFKPKLPEEECKKPRQRDHVKNSKFHQVIIQLWQVITGKVLEHSWRTQKGLEYQHFINKNHKTKK